MVFNVLAADSKNSKGKNKSKQQAPYILTHSIMSPETF